MNRRQRRRSAAPRSPRTSAVPAALAEQVVRPPTDVLDRELSETDRRRLAAVICGWCAGPIEPKARGRIPKWCSAACRQRAWEQARAAASGRAAIEVFERRVEVPVHLPAQPLLPSRLGHKDWTAVLAELANQLDNGAIYERELDDLAAALDLVITALRRQPRYRSRASGR